MTGWVHQRCDEKLFTDINKTKTPPNTSYQHIFNEETTTLTLVCLSNSQRKPFRLRNEFTWIYGPQCTVFLITEKMEENLFECLNWNFSEFLCMPNTLTLQSMDRDAYQVHINSLGINRLTRFCILCFEIATQDAKSWVCECHQPEFLWRLSDKYTRLED